MPYILSGKFACDMLQTIHSQGKDKHFPNAGNFIPLQKISQV